MNILAVSGSSRKGNTEYLIKAIVREIQKNNIDVNDVYLSDISMNFCCGCLKCDQTGDCVIDDEMTNIVSKVRNADALILATPARWGLLSGELKTFLDRLNPMAVREELKGKKVLIFAIGQSEQKEIESINNAAKSLVTFCENACMEILETILICECYNSDDISKKQEYINQCQEATKRLINSLN